MNEGKTDHLLGPTACEHAVVIATIGRPQLGRALDSVKTQSLLPQRVFVVVDGDKNVRSNVDRALQGLKLKKVDVIANDRMAGASGAWNTALDRLARSTPEPQTLVVSFLDDDDWWEPTHLEEVAAAAARGADVVATTIVRHDQTSPDGAILEPPGALVQGDFLRGNPGVQSSNLSARLSALLEAGLFDEALQSCTDRDLCIRLADLGVPYEGVRAGRIHHDATETGRLSTPGSDAKRKGLDVFHAKYAWRMTQAEERAFLERGQTLFGWTSETPPAMPAAAREVRTTDRMAWVVAAIIDSEEPARALPFIDHVARLAGHPRVTELQAVLLQNGPAEGFTRVVEHARALGLRVRAVPEHEHRRMGAGLGLDARELAGRKSIAVARSVLQQFTYDVARQNARPVVWIVDDDIRLPRDLDLFVDDIARARASDLDVAIGMVAGAPPVPAATTLRTQLVDLVSFLRGATVREAHEPTPDVDRLNARWRSGRHDYYYDLVRRQTDRLETPFLPRTDETTLGAAVAEIARRAPRILAGEQIFRPVLATAEDPLLILLKVLEQATLSDDEGRSAPRSLVRGGNTFVFDVDLLRDVPNLSPRIGDRRLRRSDTLWALLARHRSGRSVHVLPIFVEHDRSQERSQGLEPNKLFDDILGYGFARAFEEHFKWRHEPAESLVPFDTKTRANISKRAGKLVHERLAELRLSCFRIRGLARIIDRLLDEGPRPCGLDDDGVATLRRLATTLRDEFAEAAFHALERRITDAPKDQGFAAYLDTVEASERFAAARRCCEANLARPVDEVLGAGGEGVVFRAGARVAKVFDRWSQEDRAAHLPALHELAQRPAPGALPRILAVHEDESPVIVELEWKTGDPYTGGRGPEIVALLRALRAAGWAHSNVHPKNLLVTPHGLRLIDIGRSLVPFSAEAEEHVARRALLSMRYADRPDLGELMSRSIEDAGLPELHGIEQLLAAVRGEDPKAELDEAIGRALESHDPGPVLDFGCGKPRPFHRRIADGSLAVFDPDATLAERWAREAPKVVFLDEAALRRRLDTGPRVNAVVCSLVLCCLEAKEMVKALARVRRLVEAGGVVLVAVCDPRAVHVEHTARHHRFLPEGARYDESFSYVKQVLEASARVEHHRPLSVYRRAFFDAELDVASEQTIDGVDTERFAAASEFVLFSLHARSSTPQPQPERAAANMVRSPGGARSTEDALAGLTVLSYHRVADERPADPVIGLHRARGMVVSPAAFAAQMCAIGRLFEPVRAEDVYRAASGRSALPRRAAWITFDDGYVDIVNTILPVLERERIFATFFARVPREDGLPSWAPLDLCYQVLARTSAADPRALMPQGVERERLLSAPYLDQIRHVLKLSAQHGVDVLGLQRRDLYAPARVLADLRSRGFSIGAHGTEHVRWTTLDDGALECASRRSIDWLDREGGGAAPCVAYPDAALDARVARAAARAGFALGVVLSGPRTEGVERRLAIPREIAQDDERWVESLANKLED